MTIRVPIRVVSRTNVREHWRKRAARDKRHRGAVRMALRCSGTVIDALMALASGEPRTIILTRVAPRAMDGDNLQSSLKAVRDEVAARLGVDDGDPRITWEYAQRKGGVCEYAVEIEIR